MHENTQRPHTLPSFGPVPPPRSSEEEEGLLRVNRMLLHASQPKVIGGDVIKSIHLKICKIEQAIKL